MHGPDVPVVEPKKALRWFTIATLSFITFGFMCRDVFIPDMPAIRREYPYDGLVTELGGLEENKVTASSVMAKSGNSAQPTPRHGRSRLARTNENAIDLYLFSEIRIV
jgi:hypothetical protein